MTVMFVKCVGVGVGRRRGCWCWAWAWAWGVLSPMTDGSVGAFFFYFSQISMFLNGVGVGRSVTND